MNANPKLLIVQGIQGSGKSTFATKWVLEDLEHRVRWNNDDFRRMLGKYWVPGREGLVTDSRMEFLHIAMERMYDIVIDDMNLNPHLLNLYKHVAEEHGYRVEYRLFNTPLETCIERDSKRENPIGEKVIRETYNKYKECLQKECHE